MRVNDTKDRIDAKAVKRHPRAQDATMRRFFAIEFIAMVESAPSILVIGAGAVGALFGSALARQGARVSVVCRSDYEVVSRNGYSIRSETFGDHTFRPTRVYRDAAECVEPPDYVLMTVKVLPSVDRVALLRPVVGPSTTIVLIQNGIDIEDEIASAFSGTEILSSLAFVGVGRGAPGEINHQSFGSLVIGRYPSGIGASAERLAALFVGGGVPCKLTDNVVSARWQKAVWNTPFNPISILGGVLDTAAMLRTQDDRAFIRQSMQEVCNVAAAAGCPQSPKLIDAMIANTSSMPAYKTSMALDYENGRPVEIEAILGNVVRGARKLGVPTPALDAIYAIAKMVEGSGQTSG
jgi:2-dehydropantoate 2-reductase